MEGEATSLARPLLWRIKVGPLSRSKQEYSSKAHPNLVGTLSTIYVRASTQSKSCIANHTSAGGLTRKPTYKALGCVVALAVAVAVVVNRPDYTIEKYGWPQHSSTDINSLSCL
jgi:hypothetical protein